MATKDRISWRALALSAGVGAGVRAAATLSSGSPSGNLPFDPRDMLGFHFAAFDELFPAGEPISFDFCVDDIELF